MYIYFHTSFFYSQFKWALTDFFSFSKLAVKKRNFISTEAKERLLTPMHGSYFIYLGSTKLSKAPAA